MAALSDDNIDRKIVSLGPFKMEVVWMNESTIAGGAGVTTGSFTSDLARPIAACAGMYSVHTDIGVYTSAITTNSKTVTVTLPAAENTAVLVFGF